MTFLLPPPVPVDQLAQVRRLFTVLGDELVLQQLFGGRPLQDRRVKPKEGN